MSCFSKSENENPFQFLHYSNQFDNDNIESDLSSKYEGKEMVNRLLLMGVNVKIKMKVIE